MPAAPPLLAVVASLLIAGCGRLNFDDQAGDGAGLDALVDGEPDEDGDRIGNSDDVCPHVVDPGQADGDGDLVGDACDPEPAIPRQQIVFFDGFDGPVPGWATPPVLAGGRARLVALGGMADLKLQHPTGDSVLSFAGDVVEVGTPSAAFKQLVVGTATAPTLFYYVELIDDGTGRRRSLMRDDDGTYTEFQGLREGPVPLEPGPLRLEFRTTPDGFGAALDYGGTSGTLSTAMLGPIAGPETLIYVGDLSVALDYVIQIDTASTL